jgi:hypothetical protein
MLGKCQRATCGTTMYYLLPSCELCRVLPVAVHETKYKSEEGELGKATRLTLYIKSFIRVRQLPFHDPIFASELLRGRAKVSAKWTILGDEVDEPCVCIETIEATLSISLLLIQGVVKKTSLRVWS